MTTATTQAPTEREQYIDGLRMLADAMEKHPEIPPPYHGFSTDLMFMFLNGDDSDREAMADVARALPCEWRKSASNDYFSLYGSVAGLKIELTAYRDTVCTRRVVGIEEREVDEVVTPAVTKKVMKPVEVVEWDCGSLLAPRIPAAAALDA